MLRFNLPRLENIILRFTRLPGIGAKSAQRLALALLQQSTEEVEEFAQAMLELKRHMQFCARCGFLAEEEICQFCASARRDQTIICVVAEATDVFAIERTNDYHGLYHVLGGVISPLDGMTPDKLSIPALEERLERVEEVIIALPASTAGESTAIYISRILHEKGVKASRIARGIPMGAQFDYIDEVTMTRALEGRSEI